VVTVKLIKQSNKQQQANKLEGVTIMHIGQYEIGFEAGYRDGVKQTLITIGIWFVSVTVGLTIGMRLVSWLAKRF
jgi:hypothetical protein